MQKIVHLSPPWKQWILDNIARGCSVESMVESMVKDNYDPAFASHCVKQLALPAGNQVPINSEPTAVSRQQHYQCEPARLQNHGRIIHTNDRDVRVTFRMSDPLVVLLENLLSNDECDELVDISRHKMIRSGVVDPITGQSQLISARSSTGTFFRLNENDFIARLDRRVAEVMNWPLENGEGLQVLNYQVGGEYKVHFDYFDPSNPANKIHLANGGQRVSTLVIYLNDVESGGETLFPEANLSVEPTKGSAVYFEYCNSSGQVDAKSLHGGLPVTAGEKWIATKWMRQRPYQSGS